MLEPLDQGVHADDQRANLFRNPLERDRILAIETPLRDRACDRGESSQKPCKRPADQKPGEWDDDEDRDSRTDRGMLGNLPTDDLAVRDLHGSSAVDQCIDPPILACCMDVRKAGLGAAGDIDSGRGSMKRLARPVPNLHGEVVFRVVLDGRICRVGHALASVQRYLSKLAVEKRFRFIAREPVRNRSASDPNDGQHRRHPQQCRPAQRGHDPTFTTIQPAPRTLRMTSLSSFLRTEWIKTSTALLSTSSPQP